MDMWRHYLGSLCIGVYNIQCHFLVLKVLSTELCIYDDPYD